MDNAAIIQKAQHHFHFRALFWGIANQVFYIAMARSFALRINPSFISGDDV
jgi:hypothetical protein